jgi:hypothetical protein
MNTTASLHLTELPKTLYAKLETDRHDPRHVVLVVADTPDEMNDGEVVGVYELKDTRTVHVTRALR